VPTILRKKGYRFFFWSREGNEPPHIHVEQAERYAKFWLRPIQLARSEGFRSSELAEIHTLIEENQALFEENWNDYFTSKS